MKALIRAMLHLCGFDAIRTGHGVLIARPQHGIDLHKADRSGFNNSGVLYDHLAQEHLALLLTRRRISCVLDVGANQGQYGLGLRRLGYQGHIVSFEPVASIYRILSEAARGDPKWMTFQHALGRTESRRTIYVPHSTVFSSLLRPNQQAMELFGKRAALTRPEEVDVRRLDSVLGELGPGVDISRVLLKIDTQGFDLEVFAGLRSSTGGIAAIQSELSVIPLYDGMPHMLEAIAVYESSGFAISGIYPVSVDEESLRAIEFDCMMVRTSESEAPTINQRST